MVKTFVRAKHWLFRESAALDAQLSAAVSLWMYSMDENHFFSFFLYHDIEYISCK